MPCNDFSERLLAEETTARRVARDVLPELEAAFEEVRAGRVEILNGLWAVDGLVAEVLRPNIETGHLFGATWDELVAPETSDWLAPSSWLRRLIGRHGHN